MVATRISNLRQLIVRPNASVRRYAAPEQDPLSAGRELQVQSVIEGTIHTVGDRVRVTVRLLRVRDGASLWADRFDEPASDILTLEDSISERVARALRRQLPAAEAQRVALRPTANSEAHRLYLAGRYQWNKLTAEGQKASIRFFEQAVTADPRYALAYAGLSDAYVSLALDVLPPAEAMSKARAAANSALELDENLSEPHVSLGRVKAYYHWDWAGAGREFDRAVSLAPNSPDAHRERGLYLTSVGRVAEAISETKQSWELDPLSPMTNFALGWALMGARRYDEVLEHLRRFREVHPSHPTAFILVGLAYIGQRRYADAVAEYERALKLYPEDLLFKAQYGFSCAAAGRTREAEAVLDGLNAPSKTGEVSRYYTAVVKAGLHRNEEAIADLHSAYNARSRRLWALNVVPTWDELRLDSRFRALVTRIGLS